MAKKTTGHLDSADDIFKRTEPQSSGRDEEEYAKRYGRPTTYRLADELRDRFKEIAEAEGVGVSELAEWVLTRFVRQYEAGEIQLPKRRQEAYTLEFDEFD